MRPELIVAEKEFRDHITSKRFVVIFGIMLLLAIYAINSGMDSYNQQLQHYKDQIDTSNPDTQRIIENYQLMIKEAQERGDSPQSIQSYQDSLDSYLNPPMPSMLQVFMAMLMLFAYLGMVLGASLGFDQISREKDEGSLKFLVSSPVYRDAIVNGKTIGSIATLAAAMGAAFAITVAIIMLKGVVPGAEDLIRVFLFFIASLIYCTVFFALAMMISTLAKNTAVAAIMTVGLVFAIFIYTMLASFASMWLAGVIVGPAPEVDYSYTYTPPAVISSSSENGTVPAPTAYPTYEDSEYYKYNQRLWRTQAQIYDTLGTLSPINAYALNTGYGQQGVGYALITKEDTSYFMSGGVYPSSYAPKERSLMDALASSWFKVLALLVEIAIGFGIAYVVFMRTDVR